jgi:hypothetical protein
LSLEATDPEEPRVSIAKRIRAAVGVRAAWLLPVVVIMLRGESCAWALVAARSVTSIK